MGLCPCKSHERARLLSAPSHVGTQRKAVCSGLSPEPRPHWTPALGLPASGTVRNKFLSFKPQPAVLFQQLNRHVVTQLLAAS